MAPAIRKPRVLVLGDLVLDVVLTPDRPIETGTDVPGTVGIRQGGSAANTARWLARLGVETQLVCAVGRDGAGRSLVAQVADDGVRVRAARVAGARTGRIGVIVAPTGERSFVADRRAALALRPDHLHPEWFARIDLVHVPGYSLMGEPIGSAARAAVGLARERVAQVSCDLSSIGPLMAQGRRPARELIAGIAPDILFATETEAEAFLGRYAADGMIEHAAIVVIKRGARGARVLARETDGNILRFEKDFPGAKVVRLEQNYRSTQTILDAAHAVVSRNEGRKEKKLWTDRGAGTQITIFDAYNEYEEAEFVARQVERLVGGGRDAAALRHNLSQCL